MTTIAVPTTDPLIVTPWSDPDIGAYAQRPSRKELMVRQAATPVGAGTRVERRLSRVRHERDIPEDERVGRQLDALQSTAGWTSSAPLTVALYTATQPSGYSGNNLMFQASSVSSGTSRSKAIGPLVLPYGSGAVLRLQRRSNSITNLLRWIVWLSSTDGSNRWEWEVFNAGEVVNTWVEKVIPLWDVNFRAGTLDWSAIGSLSFGVNPTGGDYTGNLQVRDLRIGTARTAQDTPAGHLVPESSYDVRARYRDDADAKAASTLAAAITAGATNAKYTGGTWAVGDNLEVEAADGAAEVRRITAVGTSGSGGSGLTVDEAFDHAHASGQAIEARHWGPWSPWAVVKASAPPVVGLATPLDAATVTDPTQDLVHTYSSPSAKAQASRRTRIFRRVSGVDQLLHEFVTAGAGLTDTVPRFLLEDGLTYAWDKVAADSEGLEGTSPRRTFTTSFSQPAAITGLAAEVDETASAIVLTWDAAGGADHYRVWWRDLAGSWVRVDGGPEELDDGRTPVTDPTFTHHGARLGSNEYAVTQHMGDVLGETESERDEATIEAELTTASRGRWAFVVPGVARYTFELRVVRAPRRLEALVERFEPPGRGGTVLLKWGRGAQTVSLDAHVRPVTDGDISTPFRELVELDTAGWLKAPAGWEWDPMRAQVTSLVDTPQEAGILIVSPTFEAIVD